jgi:hypothetical protein
MVSRQSPCGRHGVAQRETAVICTALQPHQTRLRQTRLGLN